MMDVGNVITIAVLVVTWIGTALMWAAKYGSKIEYGDRWMRAHAKLHERIENDEREAIEKRGHALGLIEGVEKMVVMMKAETTDQHHRIRNEITVIKGKIDERLPSEIQEIRTMAYEMRGALRGKGVLDTQDFGTPPNYPQHGRG